MKRFIDLQMKYTAIALACLLIVLSSLLGNTRMALAAGPAVINLGWASTFAILSKSGITDVPTSHITGDVGSSPISGSAIGVTCAEVTGTIYSVDAAGPSCKVTNPTLLSAAVSAMEAAYTDAAGRTTPAPVIDTGAGNLGGLDLAPGIYKFSSGVNVTIPTDLTLTGGADDVWLFQIQGTLDISTNKQVILGGSAQAKNIFWQVSGVTTLAAGSVFYGTILDATTIAMQSGATLHGRALSQTAVTLIANTITIPGGPVAMSVLDAPVPAYAGVTSTHTISFTTVNALPANGRIAITFTPGFNVQGATLGTVAGPNGNFTLSKSGQTVYVTRNGDGAVFSAGAVTIQLNNIINTTTAGTSYKVTVQTLSGGTILDGPTDSSTFTITAGATFNPTTGPVNTTITVTGTGWSTGETINGATVDGVTASHTLTVSAGTLSGTIIVPSTSTGSKAIQITGSVSGAQAFASAFTITTAMSTYTPTTGPVGTVVTISVGTGWAPNDTISGVTVAGTAASRSLTVNSSGQLAGTITIPAGLTPGVKNIIITGNISGVQTSGTNFTVTAGATFTPPSGPLGTPITVTGSGWVASETFSTVTLGGTPATNTLAVSPSGVLSGTMTVPTGLTPGAKNIVLIGSGSGTQNFTGAFTVTATAAFTPSSGPVATVITVSGTGWTASESISAVTVGGVSASNTLTVTSTVLTGTITVPAGVTGGPQNIVITGATSGAQTFTNAFNVTVTINLAAGWNLVSLPLIPDNPLCSSLYARILPAGSVWLVGSYECGSTLPADWKFFVLAPGGGSGPLNTMVDGKSYWVYAYNACTLSVSGRPCPATPGMGAVPTIYQYSLCYLSTSPEGWNMLGFKCTQNMHVHDYLAGLLKDSTGMELTSSKYTNLYRYDTATGAWIAVGKDDNMTPGTGYLIKMKEAGNIIPPCN